MTDATRQAPRMNQTLVDGVHDKTVMAYRKGDVYACPFCDEPPKTTKSLQGMEQHVRKVHLHADLDTFDRERWSHDIVQTKYTITGRYPQLRPTCQPEPAQPTPAWDRMTRQMPRDGEVHLPLTPTPQPAQAQPAQTTSTMNTGPRSFEDAIRNALGSVVVERPQAPRAVTAPPEKAKMRIAIVDVEGDGKQLAEALQQVLSLMQKSG